METADHYTQVFFRQRRLPVFSFYLIILSYLVNTYIALTIGNVPSSLQILTHLLLIKKSYEIGTIISSSLDECKAKLIAQKLATNKWLNQDLNSSSLVVWSMMLICFQLSLPQFPDIQEQSQVTLRAPFTGPTSEEN